MTPLCFFTVFLRAWVPGGQSVEESSHVHLHSAAIQAPTVCLWHSQMLCAVCQGHDTDVFQDLERAHSRCLIVDVCCMKKQMFPKRNVGSTGRASESAKAPVTDHRQPKALSHGAGGCESSVNRCGVRCGRVQLHRWQCSGCVLAGGLFCKGTNFTHKGSTLMTYPLPEAPPPNRIQSGVEGEDLCV